MATSLGITNGSTTPNKTGEKGNVTNSSANTRSGALSGGKTANPTATTVVEMAAARTTMNVCSTARTQCQCLVCSADSDDSRNPGVVDGLDDSLPNDSFSRCKRPQCRPTALQKLSRCNMSLSNNWLKTARIKMAFYQTRVTRCVLCSV